MRYCMNCGKALPEDTAKFCPECGATIPSGTAEQTPAASPSLPETPQKKKRATPADAPDGLDKATFVKLYSDGRRNCVAASILGYFCTAMTAFVALSNFIDYIGIFALLDAAIILTLSLLIHLLRSRIAAVLLLAYSLYNVVTMLISTGEFSGWLVVVAGVLAVIGTFQSAKEWKDYQQRSGSDVNPYANIR